MLVRKRILRRLQRSIALFFLYVMFCGTVNSLLQTSYFRSIIETAGAAELLIDNSLLDVTDEYGPSPATVFTTDQIGYTFYIDATSQDLAYSKSSDGGVTWGTAVVINTAVTGWTTVAVWYDQWTPGDTTGTKIHIAAIDDASADVHYTFLDTNGDSLKGSMVTAVSGTTTFTEAATGPPSITKGAGGALFISGNFVNTAGGKISKSTDGAGDTWSNITPSEWSSVAIDEIQLLPLITDNDIIAIRADTANNDIDSRIYDEAADTWDGSWTSIAALTENTTYDQWFSASMKKSNGNVYLTFANQTNNSANDIAFWTFTDSGRTWSQGTDVITNSATTMMPVSVVNETTGDVYVAYLQGTLGTAMHVYFKETTDGGATWGSQTQLSGGTTRNIRALKGSIQHATRPYITWYDDGANDLYGSTVLGNVEVMIEETMLDASDEFNASPSVVFTTDMIGYFFYIDAGTQDLVYRKTSDGGKTWSALVSIETTVVGWTTLAVWYDQWTPGDTTGTKIHIAIADDAADDIFYTFLDTNGDTLKGSVVTAVSGSTTFTEISDGPPSITKGAGGALFISGNFSNTAGGKVSKSTDGAGNTWSDITPASWSSVAINQVQLLPLLTDNDIIAIRADTTNNDIDSRIYDEVTDTWDGSWTSIGGLLEQTTLDQWFSASIKKSTGNVYLAFNNSADAGTNDMEFWTLTDSGRTWSQGTNVITNSATVTAPVPLIDEGTGTIYVAYLRGTLSTAMNVYYKVSTDGGTTWSDESSTISPGIADDFKALRGNLLSDDRLYVVWYNDDLEDVYGTTIPFAPASGGSATVSGIVFTDLGTTPIGSSRTIAISMNGGPVAGTGETDGSGLFSITGLTMTAGTILTVFIDGESEVAATVGFGSDSDIVDMVLSTNRLLVRDDSGGTEITNAVLDIADNANTNDTDVRSIFSVDSGILNTKPGIALGVWGGTTFKPESAVNVGSGTVILGMFDMESNNVTMSGSWLTITGGSFTGSNTVTMEGTTNDTYFILSEGNSFNNLTIASGNSQSVFPVDGLSVDGALQASAGTYTFSTNGETVTVGGNLTLAASTVTLDSSTVTVGGNLNYASVSTLNRGTSTIVMTGTGKTISASASSSVGPNNLTINGGVTTDTSTAYVFGTLELGPDAWLNVHAPPVALSGSTADLKVMTGALISGDQGIFLYSGSSLSQQFGRINAQVSLLGQHVGEGNRIAAATYEKNVAVLGITNPARIEFSPGVTTVKGDFSTLAFGVDAEVDNSATHASFILEKSVSFAEFSGNVTWTKGNGSFTFSGSNAQGMTTFGEALEDIIIDKSANGVTPTDATVTDSMTIQAGTFTQGTQSVDINGSLTINAGTFTGTSGDLTLSGSLLNNGGTFTKSAGTVTLDGANQTLSGSNTFHDLTKAVTVPRTLTLASTKTQTINGRLALSGATSNLLSLRATTTGVQAIIDVTGTQSLSYLDVKDSNATGVELICYLSPSGCANAGNNSGWLFYLMPVTGKVFSDEGLTSIGAGKLVSYSVNGGAITDTAPTDAGGQFTLSGAAMTGGSIVAFFLDDNTEKGAMVTLGSGSSMTGMSIYQNRLIVRSDSGSVSLTNAHLDVADNSGDSDISAIYAVNSSVLNVKSGKALTVWTGDSFSPGAAVNVGSGVTVNGVFAMGANNVTLSGSWLTQGGGSFSAANSVIFDGASGSKTITSNGSSFSGMQIVAAGTYTLADELDLNGSFTSSGSPTFDTNNQTINVDGNFTVGAGTLTLGTTTLTVGGNVSYTSITTLNRGTSTIVMTGTGKTVAGSSSSANGPYNFIVEGGVSTASFALRPFGTLTVQPDAWLSSPLSIVLASGSSDMEVMTGALVDGASGIVMNSGSSISQQFGTVNAPIALLGQHIGEGNRIAAGTYDGDVTVFGISGQLATLELSPGTTTFKSVLDLTAFGVGAVLKNNVTNASLVMEGDIVHNAFGATPLWLKGNGTVTFSGPYAQSFMTTGNAFEDIIIDKSADAVSPADGVTTDSITVNAGTFDQNSQTVDSNGSLTINGGTYDNGEGLLLLAGDLLNEGGSFISDTGTVELDGTSQTLSGSNMFYNLRKYATSPRTITIAANTVQSVSGSLALSGATSNLLSIRSTVTGTQAKFNVDESATHNLQFLDVKDNNAIGNELLCPVGSGCVNSGNNLNWDFGITISITGKVYSDEGETEIGADITVAVSLNGGAVSSSDETDGNGYYSITGTEMTGGTIITLFLNGETEKAVTVTLGSGSSMTGVDLYQDRIIVRSDSGSVALTNAHLAVADNSGDTDIADIYTMDSSTLQVAAEKSLTVWEGDTFMPGGEIDADGSITINGTLTLGSNEVTVAGGWHTNAGGSFTTSALVTFDGNDGATYDITSDGSWFSDLTFAAGSSTTYQLGDDLVVGGSLTTEAGDYHFSANGNDGDIAFDVTLANDTVTLGGTWYVGGNWDHSEVGYFSPGSSTVIMNGVGGTIVGSYQVDADFYNLTINDSMTIHSDTTDDVDARITVLNRLVVNTGATLMHAEAQGSEDVGIAMYFGLSDIIVYEDAILGGAGELLIFSGASISKNEGEISPFITVVAGDHIGTGNRIAAGTYGSVAVLDAAFEADTVEFSPGTTVINGDFLYGSAGAGTKVDNSVTNSSFIIAGNMVLTDFILGSGNNMEWVKGNGTITFIGSDATMHVMGQAMEDMIIDKSSGQTLLFTSTGSTDGVTVNGGIFSQSTHPFDVNGSITINDGIFTTNGQSLNLSGDLLNEGGTFTATGGTVTLDGTNQTISGSNLFYNLTKVVTSPRTLTLAANTMQSVSGALVLRGEADNLLSIRSTQTGVQATINLDEAGTQTIDYLDVKDSNAGGEELVCLIATEGCENSLNNDNWDFGVVDEEGEDDFFFFFGQ